MDRIHGVRSPRKRAVTVNKYSGHLGRINSTLSERFNNHISSFQFIPGFDFLRRHFPGAGYFTIEIVSLCGALSGNSESGLGKGCCPLAVGMDNAAQNGKLTIKRQVCVCIAGLHAATLHTVSIQIHHNHVFNQHVFVCHPGGLDDHQSSLSVNAGNISPCKSD